MNLRPCPNCKKDLYTSHAAQSVREPEPGDFSICANCATIIVFDDALQFIEATPETLERVQNEDPEFYRNLIKGQRRMKAKKLLERQHRNLN